MTECAPDAGSSLFGAEALLQRLHAMTQEIPGVRAAEDIECVHRMRVASRRLRCALALFQACLPADLFPAWQKQVRRVTRALGAARDTDVQLDFVQQFLGGLAQDEAAQSFASYRPGLERLALRLRQRRQQLQADVLDALERLEASRLADEMGQALRQILVQARLDGAEPRSRPVYQQAGAAVLTRLEEMLVYETCVGRPECVAELHALRIAAKRLRYTLEIFAPLYSDGFKEPLKTARAIQEMAGDIHDCDVWIEYLPQFLEQERARALEYFGHSRPWGRLSPGILYLQQDRQRRRAERYREFVRFWKKAQRQDVWGGLRQTVHAPLKGSKPIEESIEVSGA